MLTDTQNTGSGNGTWNYTYDLAGRLTGATTSGTLGSNTYSYGYGAEDASCTDQTGNNPNAGMDSDQTSMTLNGTTTTYCYNTADQLISSSNAALTDAFTGLLISFP